MQKPEVKCADVERAHRTIRDKLYKYITYKNTLYYINVIPKFVRAYNDTVHLTNGMAPSRVTDSDVFAIWKRMEAKRRRSVRVAKARFSVGQHVRMRKEMMMLAKGAELNFSTEIFHIAKVICDLAINWDLNETPIEGQFYHIRQARQARHSRVSRPLESLQPGLRFWVPVSCVKSDMASVSPNDFQVSFSNASRDISEQNTPISR